MCTQRRSRQLHSTQWARVSLSSFFLKFAFFFLIFPQTFSFLPSGWAIRPPGKALTTPLCVHLRKRLSLVWLRPCFDINVFNHHMFSYRLSFCVNMAESKPKPTQNPKPGPKHVYSKPEAQPEGKIPPAKPSMYGINCLFFTESN